MKRVGVRVDGDVQGVGFRWWAQTRGRRVGLTGSVQNLWGGGVELHLQGEDASVDAMVDELISRAPGGRRPGTVRSHSIERETVLPDEASFDVR